MPEVHKYLATGENDLHRRLENSASSQRFAIVEALLAHDSLAPLLERKAGHLSASMALVCGPRLSLTIVKGALIVALGSPPPEQESSDNPD